MSEYNHSVVSSCIGMHVSPGAPVILGLSGGPDSVYLLHHLLPLHRSGRIKLITAHFDHEWRLNSNDDAQFCAHITKQLDIPCIIARASESSLIIKKNGSLEETGRRLRRHFFESVARNHNAEVIILAHHADDQQETFFIRLLRGTSLSGLQGMRTKHGLYLRPLLSIYKQDILSYLHERNINYLIDESNINQTFLRNRIRTKIIPALKETDYRFNTTFATLLTSLQKTNQFLDELTQKTIDNIGIHDDVYGIALNLSLLKTIDEILLQRVFISWFCKQGLPFTPTTPFLQEITRFLESKKNNTHAVHPEWKLVKKNNYLYAIKSNNTI